MDGKNKPQAMKAPELFSSHRGGTADWSQRNKQALSTYAAVYTQMLVLLLMQRLTLCTASQL
jgi:hypothetical protein